MLEPQKNTWRGLRAYHISWLIIGHPLNLLQVMPFDSFNYHVVDINL